MRTRDRNRGFTLVELIACLVIAGILAAVAGPNFVDMQAFSARGYADEVASSLRYAQRIAIASGCRVRVDINAAGYSAWQQPNLAACNGAGAWNTPVLRADGSALNGTTPAGIAGVPNVAVVFLAGGDLAGGAGAGIPVGPYVININGTTGRVSVQ
ncbi:MAG: GspH/FimT family pseudopilin [Steroidobacter sp.]